MNIESLEERRAVDAGQMWLDEQLPGWWMRGRVRLKHLDIACGYTCMLAQATNLTYIDAVARWSLDEREQVRFGFLAPAGSCRDTHYAHLTHYWREAILRRRKAYTLARQTLSKRRTKTTQAIEVTQVALAA